MGDLFWGFRGGGVTSKPCQNIYFLNTYWYQKNQLSHRTFKNWFRSGLIWGFSEGVAPLSYVKIFVSWTSTDIKKRSYFYHRTLFLSCSADASLPLQQNWQIISNMILKKTLFKWTKLGKSKRQTRDLYALNLRRYWILLRLWTLESPT